jgi:DUF4097 and DUF4098 domain-containing protein YvlB
MRKRVIVSVLSVGCAFALSILALDQARAQSSMALPSETFDRTMALAPGGSFAIENVNGSVTIAGWDRDAVEIHAVKMAARGVADLGRVRIDVAGGPGRVTVDTIDPHEEGVEVTVNYNVRVPRRVLLQAVATVNGTVRVTGVNAAGELHSVNGNIEISDSAGGFSARTTNGDIHIELERLEAAGPLAVETTNGAIALALPANAAANLEVRSLNGDFRSELPIKYLGAYRPRELHGRLGAGGVTLQLRTVNGSIRVLALPQGI